MKKILTHKHVERIKRFLFIVRIQKPKRKRKMITSEATSINERHITRNKTTTATPKHIRKWKESKVNKKDIQTRMALFTRKALELMLPDKGMQAVRPWWDTITGHLAGNVMKLRHESTCPSIKSFVGLMPFVKGWP